MKKVSVSGSPRENVGKKDAKRLRREGFVPCVVYGGKEQLAFYTPAPSFKDIVYTPEACIVELQIGKKTTQAVLQDIQFHPVTENILHADFLEIFDDKAMKMTVPIRMTGDSPGVIKGGKLQVKLRRLLLEALPADMPDDVQIDISKLEIGDSIKVGQLDLDKVRFMDPASSVVVMVKSARAAMMAPVGDEEEAEGEAAEGEEAEGAEGAETTEGKSPAEGSGDAAKEESKE